MKIHLISYGNAEYTLQRGFFKETALASNFFDEITVFNNEDLDLNFKTEFQDILSNHRGGGFWIWKPYLVQKMLERMVDNDILIYCDTGCMINGNGKKRFKEYIELLEQSETGCLSFELPHREIEFTKQEVFDYFKTSEVIINSNQLVGGVFFLRKCPHAIMLINKWYETLCKNPLLFTDDRDMNAQHEEFVDHRHDQSVFSVLRKTYQSEIITDETFFLDFIREGQPYPIWAARLK